MEVSKIAEERIKVVYEGVGREFKKLDDSVVEQFRQKYKLPEKFILALGGVGERKNLSRIKEVSKDYPLIISGETIPYVGDEELPLLYNAASVLLYTTLYEGFGLPIVEAMACGTVVVTSNSGAHREIAENGALYADPEDVAEMKLRVKEAIEDKNLRLDLIAKGEKRAEFFNWKKCADETFNVYQSVLSS